MRKYVTSRVKKIFERINSYSRIGKKTERKGEKNGEAK
jgi:hypothetical protein